VWRRIKSLALKNIGAIHAGGADSNEELIRLDFRIRRLAEFEY